MLAISLCVRLSLHSIVHTLISPELPHRNLSYYCLLALHIMVLFFTHILFVVNHTINATPPERLQQVPRIEKIGSLQSEKSGPYQVPNVIKKPCVRYQNCLIYGKSPSWSYTGMNTLLNVTCYFFKL